MSADPLSSIKEAGIAWALNFFKSQNSAEIAGRVGAKIFHTPQARPFCKMLNTSPQSLTAGLQNIVAACSDFYKNKEPFERSFDEFKKSFAQNMRELLNYKSLTAAEQDVLAAHMSGLSHADILGSFPKLSSVENVSAICESAKIKFEEARSKAGVSCIGGDIEPTSKINLEEISQGVRKEFSSGNESCSEN